jgi:hypothetical protein
MKVLLNCWGLQLVLCGGFVAVEEASINIEHEENTEKFGERNLSEKARFCVIEKNRRHISKIVATIGCKKGINLNGTYLISITLLQAFLQPFAKTATFFSKVSHPHSSTQHNQTNLLFEYHILIIASKSYLLPRCQDLTQEEYYLPILCSAQYSYLSHNLLAVFISCRLLLVTVFSGILLRLTP